MKGKRVLKKEKSNSSLLGTYFVSLLSVVLSFLMLFGTTFALFSTDNTSMGNEIHSGILRVDMLHVTGSNEISLKDSPGHAVFSGALRWIPGMSQEEKVVIRNEGNVDLDYRLSFVVTPNMTIDAVAAGVISVTTLLQDGTYGVRAISIKQLLDAPEDYYLATGTLGAQSDRSETITIRLVMEEAISVPTSVMNKSLPLNLKLEAFQRLQSESTP